jgi:NAD(P)-dependent dehydrogenase (short-subunit alcohol dehydrogenase family)
MSAPAHAVVTGGGSGIGLAIARGLLQSGRQVTIMGRSAERLQAALADLPGARALECDIGGDDAVRETFAAAAAKDGPVQILVNCAGTAKTAPFEKTTDALWNELWRTNVIGAVHTSRAVLPAMRTLASGRIVNIASTASLKGYHYVSAYTATKHALLGMTRALALELAGTSITVNAVCPGYTDTQIIRDAVSTIVAKTGRSEADALATFTGTNPQARLIDPDEVSATVQWLISEGAKSVTGQALVVAGGEIM